jgi:hypothetical protein
MRLKTHKLKNRKKKKANSGEFLKVELIFQTYNLLNPKP